MSGNLVFCTDSRYSQHLAVLLYSMLLNTSIDLRFFVLYSSLDQEAGEELYCAGPSNSWIKAMRRCMKKVYWRPAVCFTLLSAGTV